MASILRVNTLTDASSNNSIATSFVASGSAKWWVNLQGTDTFGVTNSFNNTSATDHGTGDYTCTMATDFGSATDKSLTFGTFPSSDGGSTDPATSERGSTTAAQKPTASQAAGTVRIEIRKGSTGSANGGLLDISAVYLTGHGDLA
tara:strand:- start:182 stop:619 length:438 start_codon:yes stop_codon:yes gene_type:complete